jgi:hypothetical protein
MANFTHGPWNVHRAYPIEAAFHRVANSSGVDYFSAWTAGIASGDTLIGEVSAQKVDDGYGKGWPTVEDVDEAKANAHIIVAAPDMYEALKLALAFTEDELEVRKGSYLPDVAEDYARYIKPAVDLVASIRAALDKADGKQAQS